MIFVAAVFGIALGAQAMAVTTDATLSNLVPSIGVMTKASDNTSGFSSAQLAYRVVVPSASTPFSFTPTSTEAAATIEVSFANGSYTSLASGTASNSYSLAAGVNLIKVRVTAPDTTTTKIYEIRVVKDLNQNTAELKLAFTGLTQPPSNLALLGAQDLEVAWTLSGVTPADTDFEPIDKSTNVTLASATTVKVPNTKNQRFLASDVFVMTVRGLTTNGSIVAGKTPKLFGFIGTTSNPGYTAASNTSQAPWSSNMVEVISLGQFADFYTLQTAFVASTVNLKISCQLPSTVKILTSAFSASPTFNDSGISSWDMANVTDINSMFTSAAGFNQDLSAWYTGSVKSMQGIFSGATAFNGAVGTWNTSNATNLYQVFYNASSFNQPLTYWTTPKVTTMADMFFGATSFNSPLGNWDTSKVTNMAQMFRGASVFNQDIGAWDVSKVTSFTLMFHQDTFFNQNLSSWNLVSATNLEGIFNGATRFNNGSSSGVSGTLTWNTSNVTTFKDTFRNASAFNQNINAWNTGKGLSFQSMFLGATSFNQPLNNWDTSKATTLADMFFGAIAFNQSLNSWDVSSVTIMSSVFSGATAFNNGMATGQSGAFTWKMGSGVTTMNAMFAGAQAFNQDMSSWRTNAVTNAKSFLTSATTNFNQSLAFLNVGNYNDAGAYMIANVTLMSFPSSMSSANVLATLDSWANRDFNKTYLNTFKFTISLSGQQVAYNDCHSYAAWQRLTTSITNETAKTGWAVFSGGSTGSAPTGCGTAPVVTWAATASPTNATVSNGVIRFTPDASPAASGYSGGFAYVVASATLGGNCSVSQSGEITFTIGGSSCDIKVYTTDPNSYIGSITKTFSTEMAPGAPVITGFTRDLNNMQRIQVSYTAGTNYGGPITKYQFSTDGGITWANQYATPAAAPATVEVTGQSTAGNPALVNGRDYNVQIRAFNTVAGAASNVVAMSVDVALPAPTVSSATPGDRSISVAFTQTLNTGSAVTKYQYSTDEGTHWVDAPDVSSPVVATIDTSTGSRMVNGTPYLIRIRAFNTTGGDRTINYSATPQAPPGAPTSVSITPGNQALTVNFTTGTNNGSAITKYQYSTNGGSTWFDKSSTNASTTSFVIGSLTNGTTYQVQIRAFNTISGDATASIAAIPDVLPNAPTLTAVSPFSGRLDAVFTAPATNTGSAITIYQYSTDGGSTWRTRATGTTASPISITTASGDNSALVDGTSYNIKIRAFNTGAGTASSQLSGIPDTVPEVPADVVITPSDKQLSVAFTQPSNSGSAITKYQYTTDGGTSWKDSVVTTSPVVITTVSSSTANLVNGTSYNVKIRGFNTSPGGATTQIAVTANVAPGAPTINSFSILSAERLTLNYTAGSNSGSAITKYQYSTDGGSTWLDQFSTPVAAPSLFLLIGQSGPTNPSFVLGTKYNVKIRAFNTIPGAASNTYVMFVDFAPGAPTLVSATPGDTSVSVAFNPGTNTGTTILKYQYSTNSGTNWVDASGTTSPIVATTNTATGLPLTNGSPYYIKIRAVNNLDGAASLNSSQVTPDVQPGVPTGVSVTAGSAQLSVAFTAGVNIGSALTKYQYSTDGGATWKDRASGTTGSPLVISTISGSSTALVNGTTYQVQIRAFNSMAGVATASTAAAPDVAPAAPTSLVLTSGPAKLTATFSAGAANGSAITKYQYSTNGGTDWADVAATSSPFDILTKSDDGLSLVNGTTYQVKIRAFNTLAGAANSSAVAGTPNPIAPTQPRSVTGVSGAGAVEVTWLAPLSDGGATISGYTVTSTPGSYQCTTTGALTCTVSGLTNGTSYTFRVTATNTAGTSSASVASAAVIPATVPDAPTLSSAVIGNGTITVSWQAPDSNGGSAITSYTVSTSAGGFTCVTSNLTCDLTGLTNGTNYTVKVKATNALGDSAFSGTLTRKPDVAPSAPIITSIVAGDRELKIYFTLPASNGGSAVSALLSTMNGGTSWATTSTLTSPLTIQIQNEAGTPRLVNGTEYTVQLATANSIQSAWSTAQSGTPNVLPSYPVAPSAVAGEGKATVSWSAASTNGGSAILGYTVTSNPGSLTCTTTGSTSCEVPGLTNGVAYTFTVVATNLLGAGPASESTGAVKPDVVPGAPTNLSVERGDRTLAVSFTAGTNTGSAIVKYQYSFNGTAWSDFATNSAATTQTISGLTNGSSYTLVLRAVNTLASLASDPVTGVPRAAPGAPASFALTPGFKEISVSWANAIGGGTGVGTTGGSNITKYQYSLNGGAWTDFAGTSSPQVITGLLNAVSYSVKIRAYSDIPGVESSSLSASPIKNSQDPLELTVAESVTWTNSPNRTATLTYSVGGSLTLQSTGGSGTGVVVYTATNDSACSVVNTTLLIPNAGDTCKVTATKVADGDYSSEDSPTVWIVTERAAQTPLVWKSQSSVIFGQSFDVTYAGGSGGGAISVTSQDTSVCTVSGSTLIAVGVGTCTIAIQKALSTNYSAAQVDHVVTVGVAAQSVSFTSQVPATPLAGDTYTVTATSTSGASPTFTIVSGDCTVSGGEVTFAASGDCVIRASATRTNYSNASKTQTISVGQRNQTLSFALTIQNMNSKTYGSPAFFADASTTEATLTPSYALGLGTTNSACSVSTSGIVQLLAAGICEIEVSQAGSAAVAAASSISKTFTVLPDQASQPFITSVSAGHQSITTAFIKPSYSGGSPITAYRVDAVFAGGVESTSACAVDAGSTQTCTISGLTNGTSYQVKVAAITLAGAGIFSDLAAARVPATNPAAVSAFTAVPDNTTIALSWENPISLGGGTFDSYRIFYKRSSVSSYPTSYINVQSQTPKNYTITGLINGESYDVKIVTVTTANTASLTSNTAEVKETPRTVPDAPATVDVLEVAGKVVITWSAPQSDGGNPVNEYRVTINGSTCSLANALDNLCEITAPTSSGTYPIEVKAKNDAGYSSPATATFTKAGVPSSGGGSSTPGGTESAPNGAKAIQILTVSIKSLISSGGQVVSVTGKNFTGVTTVLVGGVKAKIISVKDGLIKFTAPRNTDGSATLTVKSPTASAEVVDAFTYSKGIAKVKVAWVLGFVQANTTIKAADKAKLRSALLKNTGTVAVTCVGYQSYSYNTAKDAQTAMGRAKQACNYLKSVNPKLTVKSVIARTTLKGTASRKLAVQFKTSK